MFVTRALCDMLCFSKFIEKYVVSGGTQTRIFPSNPIPKVELDSFFIFILTGPNTPLYIRQIVLEPVYIFLPFASVLFERSEFLIATCKKKKTDRLCVCLSGCSANLGFSVEKLSWF